MHSRFLGQCLFPKVLIPPQSRNGFVSKRLNQDIAPAKSTMLGLRIVQQTACPGRLYPLDLSEKARQNRFQAAARFGSGMHGRQDC